MAKLSMRSFAAPWRQRSSRLVLLAVLVTASFASAAVVMRLSVGRPAEHARIQGAAAHPRRHPRQRSQPLLNGVGVLRLGSSWENASGYGRYAQLIVSSGYAAQAAHQRGQSFVYFTGTDVNVRYSTGVPYSTAAQRGWLLHGPDGSVLEDRNYPGNFIGDVGDANYRKLWADNVSRFLRVHRDSGVMIDNVLRDIKPLAGTYPTKYPSQPQWAGAMAGFVRVVGKELRQQGFAVAVNAVGYTQGDPRSDDGTLDLQWWRRLAPNVDVLLNEYYQQNPSGDNPLRSSGNDSQEHWDGWQRLVDEAQSMHKGFMGITYGNAGDAQAMMYGRASFLMDWDGGPGSFIFNPRDNSDPWSPVWTADVGLPVGTKRRVGIGWLRSYTGGIALVNPSSSASQTFQLGGIYRTPDGDAVTSVTLNPTSGMILVRPRPLGKA